MVLQFFESSSANNVNAVDVILTIRKFHERRRNVKGARKEAFRFVGWGKSFGDAVRNNEEIQISPDFVF